MEARDVEGFAQRAWRMVPHLRALAGHGLLPARTGGVRVDAADLLDPMEAAAALASNPVLKGFAALGIAAGLFGLFVVQRQGRATTEGPAPSLLGIFHLAIGIAGSVATQGLNHVVADATSVDGALPVFRASCEAWGWWRGLSSRRGSWHPARPGLPGRHQQDDGADGSPGLSVSLGLPRHRSGCSGRLAAEQPDSDIGHRVCHMGSLDGGVAGVAWPVRGAACLPARGCAWRVWPPPHPTKGTDRSPARRHFGGKTRGWFAGTAGRQGSHNGAGERRCVDGNCSVPVGRIAPFIRAVRERPLRAGS